MSCQSFIHTLIPPGIGQAYLNQSYDSTPRGHPTPELRQQSRTPGDRTGLPGSVLRQHTPRPSYARASPTHSYPRGQDRLTWISLTTAHPGAIPRQSFTRILIPPGTGQAYLDQSYDTTSRGLPTPELHLHIYIPGDRKGLPGSVLRQHTPRPSHARASPTHSYHKLRKTFSIFYRRHYELISKYDVGLKKLLGEGL